jgi:DNA-binding SARP family transcriptional activator
MTLVVHLMGTARLVRDGGPVDVGGPKQQAVLAVLALSSGRRVSTDRLVNVVWDENPPASERRTVPSYIASLRWVLARRWNRRRTRTRSTSTEVRST